MSDVTVTPEALVQASSGVKGSADTLDERVRALTSRVDALLNGGWSGQAADSFRRDWEQWRHGAKDVVGGLDTAASVLASSAQSYSRTEQNNTSTIAASASGLNMDV